MYVNFAPTPVGVPCRLRLLSVLLVFAFLCQLAGFVAPGWIVMSIEGVRAYFGLWFFILCTGGDCVTHSMSEMSTLSPDTGSFVSDVWTDFQIESSIAVVCCIVALVCRLVSRQSHVLGLAAFFSFVSGILSVVASGIFLAGILRSVTAFEVNPYEPPFALIANLVGGCLACVAGVVSVYSACKGSGDPQFQNKGFHLPAYPNQADVYPDTYPEFTSPAVTEKAKPDPRY